MPVPMSTPSRRAVTSTSRCRFSRRISVWPGSSSMAVSDPSVAVDPFELTSIVLLIPSSDARALAGKRTRSGYGRPFISTGAVAGSPSTIATLMVPSSSGVKPARSVASGLTVKRTAGPLVVRSMPSAMSTMGVLPPILTLPSASATCGAHVASKSGSCANNFTTTGSGAPVRSPIMSCSF